MGGGSEATFAHHSFLEALGITSTTENRDESRILGERLKFSIIGL